MSWLEWFARPENTKPLALIIFFVVFVGIIFYVYGSRKRGERLEAHKNVIFLDDDDRKD
jgi:cbb3-type cytochrome oxidase subunit 3